MVSWLASFLDPGVLHGVSVVGVLSSSVALRPLLLVPVLGCSASDEDAVTSACFVACKSLLVSPL